MINKILSLNVINFKKTISGEEIRRLVSRPFLEMEDLIKLRDSRSKVASIIAAWAEGLPRISTSTKVKELLKILTSDLDGSPFGLLDHINQIPTFVGFIFKMVSAFPKVRKYDTEWIVESDCVESGIRNIVLKSYVQSPTLSYKISVNMSNKSVTLGHKRIENPNRHILIVRKPHSFSCAAGARLIELMYSGTRNIDLEIALQTVLYGDESAQRKRAKYLNGIGTVATDRLINIFLKHNIRSTRNSALNALKLMNYSGPENLDFLGCLVGLRDDIHPGIRSMKKSSDPRAVDGLIGVAQNEDKWAILSVVKGLGEKKDPKAVPTLIELVKDETLMGRQYEKKKMIKFAAIDALGECRDPRAIPTLIEVAQNKNCFLRDHAIKALCKIGGNKIIPTLIIALRDSFANVRRAAQTALKGYDDPISIDSKHIDLEVAYGELGDSDSCSKAIANFISTEDPEVIEALLNILNTSPNLRAKISAARIFAAQKERRAVEPMIKLLKATDNEVRLKEIAEVLCEHGDAKFIEPLKATALAIGDFTEQHSFSSSIYELLRTKFPKKKKCVVM